MKTKFIAGILLSFFFVCTSCHFKSIQGDGNLVTEEISISDYDELEAACSSMIIKYVQSDQAPFLKVTVDKNIYDMYEFRIEENHKLRIMPKDQHRHNFFSATEFTVITNSRNLRKVELAGQIDMNVDSPLITDALSMDIAGSGVINLNDSVKVEELSFGLAGSATVNGLRLHCNTLKSEIAGSGILNLGGFANDCSYKVAGSGSVNAFNLESNRMKGEIAGAGDVEVFVNENIKMEVAGAAKVKYKGNASVDSGGTFMSSIEKVD